MTIRVKRMDDEHVVIEGFGVVFGGADAYGDRFTPDTDFGLEYMKSIPVYYEHGLDGDVDLSLMGVVTSFTKTDKGLWIEAQLERHNEWIDAVLQLIEQGVIGFSSGSASHLVRSEPLTDGVRSVNVIKKWPIIEISLTPTPAEPRTMGVSRTKAAGPEAEAVAEAETQALQSSDPAVSIIDQPSIHEERTTMGDQTSTDQRLDALTATVNEVLKYMQDTPSVKNVGYFSHDGGAADSHVKSFGDFALAIARGDTKRLTTVYGSKATKGLLEEGGQLGGFLVPEEYARRIIDVGYDAEPWLARVVRMPVTSPSGRIPALDQSITPTADIGQTSRAAGAKAVPRAEGGAYTETQPQFQQIEWRINDAVSGYARVSKELLQDSPISIEQMLITLFGRVNAQRTAWYVLRGTGVGQPLGIMNSPAYLTSTHASANVFVAADAANMIAKFQSFGGGEFIAHRTNMPDLSAIWLSGFAYTVSPNSAPGTLPLFGYNVNWSEVLPVTDNTGSILLIDPSAYMLFELGGGLSIEYSEHADFINGNDTWRFSNRMDGQPLIRSTIKQGNPGTAHQVSPFVGATFGT